MFIDTHVHLESFSSDGRQKIEDLLAEAKKIGLSGVCTADHYEKGVFYIPGREEIFDLDEYFQLLWPIRRALISSGTRLYIGIELGWMPGRQEHYRELLRKHPFDSVILSLHILDGEDPYSDQSIYRTDKRSLYKRYLQRLEEITDDFPDFDILAHFDYISRYAPYSDQKMRYREMPDEFDSLLTKIAVSGKSLEINTATVARLEKCGYEGQDAWPDPEIIKAYFRLGGQKISLGSDAHTVDHLGRYLAETAEWLTGIGPAQMVAYIERKPVSAMLINPPAIT